MQHVKVLSTCVVHPDAVRSLLPALIILQAVRSPTSPYDIRHCSISTQNTILSASAARGHGQLLVASRPAGRMAGPAGCVSYGTSSRLAAPRPEPGVGSYIMTEQLNRETRSYSNIHS